MPVIGVVQAAVSTAGSVGSVRLHSPGVFGGGSLGSGTALPSIAVGACSASYNGDSYTMTVLTTSDAWVCFERNRIWLHLDASRRSNPNETCRWIYGRSWSRFSYSDV